MSDDKKKPPESPATTSQPVTVQAPKAKRRLSTCRHCGKAYLSPEARAKHQVRDHGYLGS